MAGLCTGAANNVPVKVVILKTTSLAEPAFDQKEIGNLEYGCGLVPIDFVGFANAVARAVCDARVLTTRPAQSSPPCVRRVQRSSRR
jgi:hypothetical protein